ncbi:MAG: hypothetical protein WC499_01860 [Patescibacteria group bacterium]
MDETKTETNLKDEPYYRGLYDHSTIEECRSWEKRGISKDWISTKDSESKKNKIKKEFKVKVFIPTVLYFVKGERYAKKSETINKWIDRDRRRDERFKNTPPPESISCFICGSIMTVIDKTLHTELDESKDRVLFFFECPKCHKRRAFWDNGEEWRLKPTRCPKCKTEMRDKNTREKNKITTVYNCPKCHHKEKEVLNLDEKLQPKKIDPYLKRDRQRFCLSDEEGQKYLEQKINLENVSKFLKEFKEKEKTQKILVKIKKLTIVELQKLLVPVLEKNDYLKLDFSKPEINRDVIINFTVQDNKSGRVEYDSRIKLQRLIKKILLDTNWRLMSEGINYRLGILSGRLKGYESEEDLLKLIKK